MLLVPVLIASIAIYTFLLSPQLKQISNTKAEPNITNTFLEKIKEEASEINYLKLKKENKVDVSLNVKSPKSQIKLNSSVRVGTLQEEQEDEQILIGEFIDADNLESIQADDDVISIGEFIDVDKQDDPSQEDNPQSIGEFIDVDMVGMGSEKLMIDDKEISLGKFINVNDLNNIVQDDEDSVSIGEFIPLE